MNKDKKNMLANIVRQHREAMGYTQKEVSEISKVSLRSIQRIEKGEVTPRMYTVRVLAECLNFSLDFLNEPVASDRGINTERRLVLAIGSALFIILLAMAFIAQSPGFPETAFEETMYWSFVVLAISAIQYKLWAPRN